MIQINRKAHYREFILGIVGVAVASLACSIGAGSGTATPLPIISPLPTYTPYPTLPALPTYTPYPTFAASAALPASYFDDFSDSESGWTQFVVAEGVTDYSNNTLRIIVNEVEFYRLSHITKEFSDSSIAVQVVSLDGPDDAEVGVICRYQDDDNFYLFSYTADGFYAIAIQTDGDFSLLSGERYMQSNAILKGNSANQLTVSCIGDTLSFYINGVKVSEVVDTTFSRGYVGLLAGTFEKDGTAARFDNFTVFEP